MIYLNRVVSVKERRKKKSFLEAIFKVVKKNELQETKAIAPTGLPTLAETCNTALRDAIVYVENFIMTKIMMMEDTKRRTEILNGYLKKMVACSL